MDSENLTITLPRQDWQLIQVALGELQAKFAIPVMGRLQTALAEAQAETAAQTKLHAIAGGDQ